MKALLIHRFFYPDSPPYAVILKNMSQQFLDVGFDVDILSSKPSYKTIDVDRKERYKTIVSEKLSIFRLPVLRLKTLSISKLFNFFWFPLAVFFWIVVRKKYSVVSVSTAPPVVLAFLVALACRIKGTRLIYHCMDIHPEIGKLSGEFKNENVFKLLTWMDNFTCDMAYKIIVLSQEMKNSLIKRRESYLGENIVILNNFELPSEGQADVNSSIRFLKKDGIKRVVFTGNIGRYQNLDSFIFPLLKNKKLENFELVFVGEGSALSELKKLSKPLGDTVKFIPHQPLEVAKLIIRDADMAIVSLNEKVIEYAYPSKTMTYLSLGTPILLNIERGNDLFNLISNKNIGVAVNSVDESGLYKVYINLCNNSYGFSKEYIRSVYLENFSVQIFNKKLKEILSKLRLEVNVL